MKIARLQLFRKEYQHLPRALRAKVDRQLHHLAQDLRHPGLSAKKMSGPADIWEARVDYHHRLTFHIAGDTTVMRRVGSHDILKQP